MLVYDICMVFFICYVVLTRKLFICLIIYYMFVFCLFLFKNNFVHILYKTHTCTHTHELNPSCTCSLFKLQTLLGRTCKFPRWQNP